ncbi:universal stress protein [Streptomyces sp. NPDC059994]|uniref:universal stress protein n=1 Tax=Streptomyces sp. NPDC059994 TaxID=3347029 RepID=UPI0036945033
MIVGIDPRQQSVPALAWAVDEDVRRRLSLRLVTAVPPLPGGQHTDAPWRRTTLRAQGDDALAEAVATVRALHAEVPLTTELLDGTPSAVLCQKAARAQMTVVGSRRLTRPEELFSVGSVAVPVSAQADCPVVVVREPEHAGERHPHLVVGVDGSESSRAAVEFAVKRQRCTALPCGPCGCGGGP